MAGAETWNFGQLESALSQVHLVVPEKRTAFQARLKNFHRLGFPPRFVATKGRATEYRAEHVLDMALAVELTQLGLRPDRVATVLSRNRFEIVMAARLASNALLAWRETEVANENGKGKAELLQMYLYFDPEALEPLTHGDDEDDVSDLCSFFYGGHGVIADMLKRFEPGGSPRLSLINLTGLIATLEMQLKRDFLGSISAWSNCENELEDSDANRRAGLKGALQLGLASLEFQTELAKTVRISRGIDPKA